MPLVNGREYEWADLSLVVGGRDLSRFRGIKYTKKAEKEHLHAKGRHAHSIQTGNITCEGEMVLLQSEYEALVRAGGGSILGLVMDALVAYGNPASGDAMIADRIESLQFTEEAKEFKQGDKFMECTVPFLALDIKPQI